jgi:hypothetical protein
MAVWAIAHNVDCSNCQPVFQTARGCVSDRQYPLIVEGFETLRCPASFYNNSVGEYLQAYAQFKAGFLPESGGWLDQPIKFLDVMSLIDRLMNRFEQEKDKNGVGK